MAITKNTIVDKAETVRVQDHYCIQIRERKQIIETDDDGDSQEISSSFHRYVLNPDHDVTTITDATVKAQFQAVMTEQVKANYQAFKEAQEAELNPA
tara:strand:- start:79 stop:369 length:291 start_codon:yes stop_codon:yes gene_type:complete